MKICYIKLYKEKKPRTVLTLCIVFSAIISILVGYSFHSKTQNSVSTFADINEKEQLIIIDAGHGGEDPGAVGKNGVLEKDLNLDIAKTIGKILENNGFTVIYTRTEDKLLYKPEEDIKGIRKISDLKNRCKISLDNPEAMFVSIHMNSYGSEKYSGLQVYYSENNKESEAVAAKVQDAVKASLQPNNNRKTKPGEGMYLLEHTESPAILIECGFLTNREECARLTEKEYQNNLSFAIVCGIIEYVEEKNNMKD